MSNLNHKRKIIRPIEIVIIIAIMIVCVILFFFLNHNSQQNKPIAVISYNGKIVKEINLSSAKDQTFTLNENHKVSFQIKNGEIKFVDTDCPDKLCENVGFIHKTNQIAICMPNKVSLKIIDSKQDFDMIVN